MPSGWGRGGNGPGMRSKGGERTASANGPAFSAEGFIALQLNFTTQKRVAKSIATSNASYFGQASPTIYLS